MAGGPSCPALVDAVAAHGGLGFLAAGYKTPDAIDRECDEVARRARDRGAEPFFGLNIFIPQPSPSRPERDRAEAYRDTLQPYYESLGLDTPELTWNTDDHWEGKLAIIRRRLSMRRSRQKETEKVLTDDHAACPSVVSFTFGLPSTELIDEFHTHGIEVWATVSTVRAACDAAKRGVAGIIIQGVEAGGHRATLTPGEEPNSEPLLTLLRSVSAVLADTPQGEPRPAIIAAGGISTRETVVAALSSGADAIAAGTVFAATEEAGTNEPYRQALISATTDDTVVTRAYSGRPARGRRNEFIDAHPDAPAVYPAVNGLTSPIRKIATTQGNTEYMSLWAGQGVSAVQGGQVGDVVYQLDVERRGLS